MRSRRSYDRRVATRTLKPILWGARMDGEVYGTKEDAPWSAETWNKFIQHAGKPPSIVHWGQPFGALDLNACNLVKARGAVSLVSIGLNLPNGAGEAKLQDVAAGKYNQHIDTFATACKSFSYPIILNPWREMNGTWYSWGRSGETFKAAWKVFVTRIRDIASNVSFVWCPNTIWDAASDPAPMLPDLTYVDWVGIDGYNRNEPWFSPYEVFKRTYDRLVEIAPGKPIMICETASEEAGGSKAAWITNFLTRALPERFPKIRAFVWFNWNIVENGRQRQWPIESSATSQSAFKAGIASSYYLAAPVTQIAGQKLLVP